MGITQSCHTRCTIDPHHSIPMLLDPDSMQDYIDNRVPKRLQVYIKSLVAAHLSVDFIMDHLRASSEEIERVSRVFLIGFPAAFIYN